MGKVWLKNYFAKILKPLLIKVWRRKPVRRDYNFDCHQSSPWVLYHSLDIWQSYAPLNPVHQTHLIPFISGEHNSLQILFLFFCIYNPRIDTTKFYSFPYRITSLHFITKLIWFFLFQQKNDKDFFSLKKWIWLSRANIPN